mmetsp:Transcript_14365/g.20384  ORF Transcript_14365/g.20384 Transcript_14365/m.20384 type:complete len:129 (+) Transcript_14365:198-584(+)
MSKQTEKILHLLHIFTADLILQVFGGAGAIWGFSEVLGLRTPETVWFWRPTAQFIGAVFFARWILQLDAHIKKENIEFFPQQSNRFQQLEVAIDHEEQTGLCETPTHVISPVTGIAMQNTGKDYKACK